MELKKMELTSASGSELNLEALYQIMPSAFTEVRDDKTGEITHKINFNTLRELLGDNAYEGADEEYGFKWVGKNAARREAARPINKTLRPCPEESVDWENTQNLYIEGDNLEVLKLLQKSYIGKIKMIYIDPPYNTGNDFVYRDDFAMDKDGYDRAARDVDEMGYRFRKNSDTNARFHSDWCSMIYERLLVSRSLLSEDGVIFISIDDNEVENIQKICSEIFGVSNCIARVVVNRPSEVATDLTVQKHEYCLVYAKNIQEIKLCGNKKITTSRGTVGNADQTMPIITFPKGLRCINIPDGTYTTSRQIIGSMENIEIITPFIVEKSHLKEPVQLKARWRSSNDMRNFFSNGCKPTKAKINGIIEEIYFDGDRFMPYINKSVTEKLPTMYLENKRGSTDLEKLSLNYFDFPKSVSYISFLVGLFTENNDIVLDFFSGSSTTAHAVMKLNADSNNGSRRFIMVQLPETITTESKAFDSGYNTLCELAQERIRRAGKKIKEEAGLEAQNLDTGFRVFKCEDSFMNNVYFSPNDISQADLFSQVSNIKDGTSDLSLLFGCMLDWGVQLSLPLSNFEVSGKTIYNVNYGDLVACFAEDVNEEVITAIAELMPLRVVFRDSCFSDAPLKMNLFELFKQKCGWSEEVVKNRVHVI